MATPPLRRALIAASVVTVVACCSCDGDDSMYALTVPVPSAEPYPYGTSGPAPGDQGPPSSTPLPVPSESDPDAGVPAPCTPADTPVVTLTDVSTRIDSAGEHDEDDGTALYPAIALDGTSCTTQATTVADDLVIAGVPTGSYRLLLDDGADTLDTTARTVDFGSYLAGRSGDLVCDANVCSTTFLTLRVADMPRWQSGNTLEMFVPNTNGMLRAIEQISFSSPPTPGDTSLATAFDWRLASGNELIEASEGDIAYLADMTTAPAGYEAIAGVATFGNIQQTQGGTTTDTGSFVAVAADQTLDVDLRTSSFAAMSPAVGDGATMTGVSLSVRTLPGATHGAIGDGADLLLVPKTMADETLGTIAYGNPYPSSWGTFAYIEADYAVQYPDGKITTSYIDVEDPSSMPVGGIAPILGPVTQPTVDGASAYAPEPTTVIPTLVSWSAPVIGTATAYRVLVWHPGSAALAPYAVFTTGATSVAIPATECATEPCVFEIDAISSPVDLTAHPTRTSLPYTSAPLLTGELP